MGREALIREYKQSRRPMGVCCVCSNTTGKILVPAGIDLPAVLNRHQAQLRLGIHPARDLQRDWNELWPGAFQFEVLDILMPSDRPDYDPVGDLRLLEQLWPEKLTPWGDRGYNAAPNSFPVGPKQ